jgi:hypothetical protein
MLVGKPFSNEWIDSFYEEDDWASPAGQVVSGIKTPIYRKIIVTGPQRSGTRFVGMLLNDALKDFKYMNKGIHSLYKHPTVFHAPAQSHLIQTLETEIKTLVIWVDRNSEDVIASEDKIYPHIYPGKPKVKHYKIAGQPVKSWHDRCFENEEKPKYLEMFPKHEEKIKSFDRNVHMKKWVWENIQRDKMEVDFVEVKYESLKDLDEFVPKEKRKDWTLKQVRVNGVNAYHN